MKLCSLLTRVILLVLMVVPMTAMALTPFPYARVIATEEHDVADYRIVLSGVYPGRGEPRLDREKRARGRLQSQTLEVTSDRTPREVFEHYRAESEKDGYRMVFECHGRDCGDSATWSSEIFKQPQLYGFNRDQHFFTALTDDRRQVLMVYTIRRGNQRVYVHWEKLKADQPVSGPIKLQSGSQAVLVGEDLERLTLLEKKLKPLISAAGPDDRWVLVSWVRQPQRGVDRNLRSSRQQADLVADLLRRRLGRTTPIEIYALGPWGPENIFEEEDRVISVHRVSP